MLNKPIPIYISIDINMSKLEGVKTTKEQVAKPFAMQFLPKIHLFSIHTIIRKTRSLSPCVLTYQNQYHKGIS